MREASMVTVEVDPVRVESRLAAGGIGCPGCGAGLLGGWEYARPRVIAGTDTRVRPRRARCRSCGVTHVLLPVSLLLRRAYLAELVFAALVAKALGSGIGRSPPGRGCRPRRCGAGCGRWPGDSRRCGCGSRRSRSRSGSMRWRAVRLGRNGRRAAQIAAVIVPLQLFRGGHLHLHRGNLLPVATVG